MQSNTSLLLVRPNPEPLESWRGYVLRLAADNMIICPKSMLRLSDIDEKSLRTAIPDIRHVAAITGKPDQLLNAIYPRQHKNPHYEFLGHKVSKQFLRINTPALCPQCVKASGYVHARWDVQFMNVCHIHGRALITHCPSCNQKLSWYRKGLLTCKCGHEFAGFQTRRASQAEINFAALLASIIEGAEDSKWADGNPIPVEFSKMGLDAFLGSINTLGLRLSLSQYEIKRFKTFGSVEAYEGAVKILNDWETEFKNLIVKSTSSTTDALVSFRSSFELLYKALFKKGYEPIDMEFIRNSFNKHMIELHGDSIVDVRTKAMLGANLDSPQFVGINAASKISGVMPSTLRRMIERGQIKSKFVKTSSGRIRHQIDISSIPVKLPNKLGELDHRKAAKYVGLPISVLREMRELGYYQSNHKTNHFNGWAIQDLDVFKARIESTSNACTSKQPNDPVSLYQLLYQMRIDACHRAKLVGAIIDKKIKLYGLGPLADRILSRPDLHRFGIDL